jgi:hypothetical protein
MVVTMMNALTWDVTLCDSCKKILFGRTYYLHQQGVENLKTNKNIDSN